MKLTERHLVARLNMKELFYCSRTFFPGVPRNNLTFTLETAFITNNSRYRLVVSSNATICNAELHVFLCTCIYVIQSLLFTEWLGFPF